MALSYIWAFFIISSFVAAIFHVINGNTQIFSDLVNSTFSMAKTGFEISLGLVGVMTLWLGILKIGEKVGAVKILGKIVNPLFKRLFPELPEDHPAYGSMLMNIAANMLGLNDAATPLGLKAMKDLQDANPTKDTASNAQIMFLVINTSGLTIIPVTIMVIRAQMGAANPTDIFIPLLFVTFFSTLVGLIVTSLIQKINLFDKVILAYIVGMISVISGSLYLLSSLEQSQVESITLLVGNFLIFLIITSFVIAGLVKKINIYSTFIEGAKDGFTTAVKIIPYLVGILVAIGVFRTSGVMDVFVSATASFFGFFGVDTEFVKALPAGLMKPLSGSGSRGIMVEIANNYGIDSFPARLASIFHGSTDTTFYVLAVYFGSVNIKKLRHAVPAGLAADLAGLIAAVVIGYIFFGVM